MLKDGLYHILISSMLVTCFPGRMLGMHLSSAEQQESHRVNPVWNGSSWTGGDHVSFFVRNLTLLNWHLHETLLTKASLRNGSYIALG